MRATRSSPGLLNRLLRVAPVALLAILLAAMVPSGQAATEYVPWSEQGGSNDRDHFVTTPYANPDALVDLATVETGLYGSASSPLAVDLDGDGDLEIVWAQDFWDSYGLSYVAAYDWDGANLVLLWETQLDFSTTATDATVRLASGDLDNDGQLEIVALQAAKNDGGPSGSFAGSLFLEILDGGTGTVLAGTVFGGFEPGARLVHPAIGDVDNDGVPEIMIANNLMVLYAYSYGSGALTLEWTQDLGAGSNIEYAIGEVDPNHAGLEIVVSRDASSTAGALWTCKPSTAAGNCVEGPTSAHGPVGVALRDVDGDGDLDAITGGRSGNGDSGHSIYKNDGSGSFSFFAGRVDGYTANTPAVGDVNRDGQLEFVVPFDHNLIDVTDGSGHIYSSTFDGTDVLDLGRIDNAGIAGADDTDRRNWYGGPLGNLIGDENLEYISMDSYGDLRIVTYNETGVPSLNQTLVGPSYARAPPILADINGDCALDLLAGFSDGTLWLRGDDTPRYAPGVPTNFAGTESGTAATLTWDAPASDGGRQVLEYKIFRAERGGIFSYLASVDGSTFTYTDSAGPPFPAEVDYIISAVNCMGESPLSGVVQLDVHEPPFEVANGGLAAISGVTAPVPATTLAYDDDLSDELGITFDLTVAPAAGTLRLDGTDLSLADTWTMQDLRDGKLSYLQDAHCPAIADTFNFTVADHHGKLAPESTFQITSGVHLPLRMIEQVDATVLEGSSIFLGTNNLKATDPCIDDATLTFTVDEMGALGTLYLDGTALSVGSTFTQSQLASNKVSFTATGGAGVGALRVTVTNGVGDHAAGAIDITTTAATPPTAVISAPNAPYYGGLELRFIDQSYDGSYPISWLLWEVLDDSNTIVASGSEGTFFFTPDIGSYTIRLTASDGVLHSHSDAVTLVVDRVFEPATPEFLMSDATPEAGQPVTFWDTSKAGSFDLEGREWNFQDPHPSTVEASVLHIFENPGTYQVSLKIKDAKGFEYFASHEVVVSEATAPVEHQSFLDELANQPKGMALADAGPDQVVLGGTIVELDGRMSRPGPAGNSLSYKWTQVGGMQVPIHGNDTMTPRVSLPFMSLDEGEVLFQLVVTDDQGQVSAPDVIRLLVRREGTPSLKPIPEPTGDFAFEASQTGNVTFVPLDETGPGVLYTWDFGDGQTAVTDTERVTHRYESAGVYQVRLRVEDSFGRVAEYQRAVAFDDPAALNSEDETPQASPRPASEEDGNGVFVLLMVLAVLVTVGALGFIAYTVVRTRTHKA